jgi:hypothetical protein
MLLLEVVVMYSIIYQSLTYSSEHTNVYSASPNVASADAGATTVNTSPIANDVAEDVNVPVVPPAPYTIVPN